MPTARLKITSGPEKGKVFELNAELVNIGHGAENEVVLADPTLEDYQASITSRNGRYAIYTPLDRTVEVDGSIIPADRWVWLPAKAQVRVSDQTAFRFSCRRTEEPKALETETAAEIRTPAPAVRTKTKSPKRSEQKPAEKKRKREVARFVTDQSGDTLVKLGEDGQLPELSLADSPTKRSTRKREQQANPTVLYVALALSVLTSLALLLVDMEPAGSSAQQLAQARQQVLEFAQSGDDEPELYQRYLREARLAQSRNDRAAELQAYRQVLRLLNAEDNAKFTGLTGSEAGDKRLRELLGILLSD